jgi:acetyl-CoA carboxylase/biotin carboxylase 1
MFTVMLIWDSCFTISAEIRRLFGQGGGGHDSWRKVANEAVQFDLSKVDSQKPKGHVVAVRVTSEDPDDGFKPTSGQVEVTFSSPRRNPIRLD